MVQHRGWIAAFAASMLGIVAVWFAMPSTEPDLQAAAPVPSPAAVPRPVPLALFDDPGGKAKRVGKAKVKAKAREPREPPEREDALEPDERAALREEMRLERIVSLADRLDQYSAEAGWDPELTAEVEALMLGATEKIGRNLERVDRGQTEWNEIRHELRDFRIDQARSVRGLLGDEEFDRFVDGMDLVRFMGERPIRGRLD